MMRSTARSLRSTEIRQSYLLDTNAFFRLKRLLLETLHMKGYHLYASPYVFWERLCHLDKKEFKRAKGEFQKFKCVRILDDPRVAVELPSLPMNVELQGGRADIIYAALAKIEDAQSLESFYSSRIEIDGVHRQVAGCVDGARKDLEKREKQYVDFVKNIMNLFSREQILRMSDDNIHRHILALARGYVKDIRTQGGALEPEASTQIIENTYIYFSYIFHRTLKFIKDGNSKSPLNDYEDGRICLHLKLDTPYCLVTDDGGMKDALKETASLLGRLNDPQFQTTLGICDANHLINLASITP
jgi:hypothetical protein